MNIIIKWFIFQEKDFRFTESGSLSVPRTVDLQADTLTDDEDYLTESGSGFPDVSGEFMCVHMGRSFCYDLHFE